MAAVIRMDAVDPKLTIIVPTSDMRYSDAEKSFHYLRSLRRTDVECLIVRMTNEEFHQTQAYNIGARVATALSLCFTCAGVWWPNRVIDETLCALESSPSHIILAMRMDERENGGWHLLSDSWGEWQAMSKETFESVGGFDEAMRPAHYHEWDFLVRAYLKGHKVGLLQDRVWHSWHKTQTQEEFRAHNAINRGISQAKGLPVYFGSWPWNNRLIWSDGREEVMNVDVVHIVGPVEETVQVP